MRDPVKVLRERLVEAGIPDGEIEQVEARSAQIVVDAIEAAKNASLSDPSEAFTDVWADGGSQWRN
jgi:pyruvate dehydrogenase E1 component alpha subunit